MKNIIFKFAAITSLATSLLLSLSAYATLGEDVSSIQNVSKKMNAKEVKVTAQQNYNIHTLQSNAMTVNEYVSASGKVFAVSWKGPHFPDFSTLLGKYNDDLQKNRTRIPGHRSLSIKTNRFVFSSAGHMNALRGKAYDPNLVPSGVKIEDLQ